MGRTVVNWRGEALAVAMIASGLAGATPAYADLLALRCPMASVAAESLYEIDLAARTVRLVNLVSPITLPATIDEGFVAWRNDAASFRLDRKSLELMQAGLPGGAWEVAAFCVRL